MIMRTRREAIQSMSGALALPLLPTLSVMASQSPPADFQTLVTTTTRFFSALGYKDLPPKPLITGDPFNGGVCFDDTREKFSPGRWYTVQSCSRVEDYKHGDQPATLALFHIFSLYSSENSRFDELLTQMLEYLTKSCKLDPKRMALVSTKIFKPYLDVLPKFGIKTSQFIERNLEEANARGDGSGFFNPKGLPHLNGGFPTASFHYAMKPDTPIHDQTYPPKGFIELGEVGLTHDPKNTSEPQSGGFGLERVLMAMGKPVPTFNESRQAALEKMQDEAQKQGEPLPPAYRQLTNG